MAATGPRRNRCMRRQVGADVANVPLEARQFVVTVDIQVVFDIAQ